VAESHQEIIGELLKWYIDVLNGVHDGVGDDPTHLPLMCLGWNSPAYREHSMAPLPAGDAEPLSCSSAGFVWMLLPVKPARSDLRITS
jgi:hypothetical protein